jgi:hypothetical protein
LLLLNVTELPLHNANEALSVIVAIGKGLIVNVTVFDVAAVHVPL